MKEEDRAAKEQKEGKFHSPSVCRRHLSCLSPPSCFLKVCQMDEEARQRKETRFPHCSDRGAKGEKTPKNVRFAAVAAGFR